MEPQGDEAEKAVDALIDEYRTRCLWFLRTDCYSTTTEERLRLLKDPGFSPASLLEHASRSGRYSAEEVRSLAFDGPAPDPGDLSRRWRALLAAARAIVGLPAEESGKGVLDSEGRLFTGDGASLREAVASGSLRFHAGRIRGAFPAMRGT